MIEANQKTQELQMEVMALQMAEATLKGQLHELDSQVNQGILDTLEREKALETKLDSKVEHIEKRVPTSSELSALKQKASGQSAGEQAAATSGGGGGGKGIARSASNPNGYSDEMRALEKATQERVNSLALELRSEVQKQTSDITETLEANKMRSDGEMQVLRNDLQEQVKRVRYVDKISRTSAGIVLKNLPDGGDHKALEEMLADGLLEGRIEKDLIDETNDLRKQLGSLEAKLAKILATIDADKLNMEVAAKAAEAAAAEDKALAAAEAAEVANKGAAEEEEAS